jgi:hypothetical protein
MLDTKQELSELFTKLYCAMLSIKRDQCIIKSNQVANTGGGHHRIISRLFRWEATHYKDELHF